MVFPNRVQKIAAPRRHRSEEHHSTHDVGVCERVARGEQRAVGVRDECHLREPEVAAHGVEVGDLLVGAESVVSVGSVERPVPRWS